LDLKLPEDFLWGTATSAFQIEMGMGEVDVNSDWYVWVHDEDNIRNGIVSGDLPENGPGFWELYPSDLRLAKEELRNNAFRMSIDWSRIFPEPTWDVPVRVHYDSDGNIREVDVTEESIRLLDERAYKPSVRRYREILSECRNLGLTVLLTLYHWPLPLWIHDPIACRDDISHSNRRGWLDQRTIIEFAKYSAFIAKTFGDLVDIYATMNEPMVVSGAGYFSEKSGFPPGINDLNLFVKVTKNLALAHGIAYEQIKRWDENSCSKWGPAYVGIVHNPQYFEAYNADSREDVIAAEFLAYLQNEWFLNMIVRGDFDMNLDMRVDPSEQRPSLAGRCDFIGVNYYMRIRVKGAESRIPGIPGYETIPCRENCTDMGWEIYPEGIRYELNWAYRLYRRPVMVTENGIADAKDEKRSEFLRAHISEVEKAINDGVPVEGYFYWSLIDNFEWAKGFKMRFGLFRVDYETKRRIPTKAVKVYRQIIEGLKSFSL